MTKTPLHSPGSEARDTLAAVLHDQQERAGRRNRAGPASRQDGPAKMFMALALAALTVWVWVSPPSLVRPPPPPPIAAPVAAAELRLTVFQAVMAVERYAKQAGAVPLTLTEVLPDPVDIQGLTYERLDPAHFRLTGQRGERVVVFESGDSIPALVGDARRVLETER